jgi:hypothetical protein
MHDMAAHRLDQHETGIGKLVAKDLEGVGGPALPSTLVVRIGLVVAGAFPGRRAEARDDGFS